MVTTITREPMVAITDHQMVSEMPVAEVEIITAIPIMYVYSLNVTFVYSASILVLIGIFLRERS